MPPPPPPRLIDFTGYHVPCRIQFDQEINQAICITARRRNSSSLAEAKPLNSEQIHVQFTGPSMVDMKTDFKSPFQSPVN